MDNRANNQILELRGRSDFTLNDCIEILTFNEQDVLLKTASGLIHIGGVDLKITALNLDQGQIALKGLIYVISYSDEEDFSTKGGGFFSRLFK